MFSVRYRFHPKDADSADYLHELWSFVGGLLQNGQLIDADANLARVEARYEYASMCPEAGSLDAEWHDEQVKRAYDQLVESSSQAPAWEIVGEVAESGKPCVCEKPSSYVLFTVYNSQRPPVLCSDCGGYVAQYRLPKGPDYALWAEQYRACDRLYISSGVGEMFGLRQMKDPKSKLTQDGLVICRELADMFGKPVYYYLWTSSERTVSKCPSCKEKWETIEPLAGGFDRVCRHCGFVAISNDFC